MKALVHIGMPKTGSTSIQAWLRLNRAALRGRGVVHDPLNMKGYPKYQTQPGLVICQQDSVGRLVRHRWIRMDFGLSSLAAQAEVAERFRGFFGARVAAAREAGAGVFVLSCEALGGSADAPAIAALDAWLTPQFERVEYLVYFRRQEDWLPSSYSQRIRRGDPVSLEQVIERHGRQNWHAAARAWSDTAGRGRVHVRLLESDALAEGDLIEDFARALGTTAEGLPRPPRLNEALSAPAARLLSEVNRALPLTDGSGRKRNPLHDTLRQAIAGASSEDQSKVRLSAGQIGRIRDMNAESNERLRRAFFPGRPVLFPERPAPAPSEPGAEAQEVAQFAAQLMVRMARRGRGRGRTPAAAAPRRLQDRILRRLKTWMKRR